jgi:MFS transporter, DHA1 family, inner membrane transport protein
MSSISPAKERNFKTRLFLPFLMLANFLIFSFAIFLNSDLVDVAATLKVSVGTASQILTVSSFLALIMGVAVGFLVIRFKHKSLFLIGLAFFALGALGCFFAPNFALMLFFNIFVGGGAMAGIMIFAMIGDFLPLQKKGLAVGLVVASGGLVSLIMPQVTSIITNAGGWRAVLLWFIFPLSLVTLLFGFFLLPSTRQEQIANKAQYRMAFRQILKNHSARACLVATALMWFSFVIPVYGVTFYRLHFQESLRMATIFYSLAATMLLLGGIVGGRLINRVGRKRLAVVAGLIQGTLAALMVFIPNVWASLVTWMGGSAFAGVINVALLGLVLEQVPSFRGTMVSINTSFHYVGYILALAISGLLLNIYANNFQIVYAIFGAAAISSAVVLFLFAKDPCIKIE